MREGGDKATWTNMYSKEENLEIYKRVGVTKEVYDLLRKEKRRPKISMAKIICNLVLLSDARYRTYPSDLSRPAL